MHISSQNARRYIINSAFSGRNTRQRRGEPRLISNWQKTEALQAVCLGKYGDGLGFVPNAMQIYKKPSILTSIKSRLKTSLGNNTPPFKIVKMPRHEYLKYFAKDRDGNHIGSEPKREWTEEMLEEFFGKWKNEEPRRWAVEVRSGIGGKD